jgi:hypothetical protein
MQNIEKKLIIFFEQVAQKDESLLKILKQKKYFCIEREGWHFTLPDLHFFLQKKDDVFHNINYKEFRKLIFNSHINQFIKLYGAKIIIKENTEKVDNSKYILIWGGKN